MSNSGPIAPDPIWMRDCDPPRSITTPQAAILAGRGWPPLWSYADQTLRTPGWAGPNCDETRAVPRGIDRSTPPRRLRSIAAVDRESVTARMGLLPEVLQLPELSLDLPLDVERLLPLAGPALVAGNDELPDLVRELGVHARVALGTLLEEPGQLGIDVERRLAAQALAVGIRLEQLADLHLALDGCGLGL